MKTVYGWVVNWGDIRSLGVREPNVTVDLFFTNRGTFQKLLGKTQAKDEILVPVRVPDDFRDLDFIPDNY